MADYNERKTETTDVAPLWETILDLNVDIAELNYANSLNADSRDQLFVDAFVDESMIQSTTGLNITTGQNGSVILGDEKIEAISDDYTGTTTTATFDIDITGRSCIISEMNMYAETSSNETRETVNFSESDYSRLLSEETITVTAEIVDGIVEVEITDSENNQLAQGSSGSGVLAVLGTATISYSGSLMSISSQEVPMSQLEDDLIVKQLEVYEGTLTSTVIDKGYTPSAVQIDADRETDSETSVSARVFDGNGNEKTISESQFGDEISVPFTDSSFQAELQLSTSNSSKSPKANDYGLRVIE